MGERERVLNVRMTEAEMVMVRDLAEAAGLSQADIIRQLVRAAHAKLDASAKQKPKRSK
jgi:hypothetical protein